MLGPGEISTEPAFPKVYVECREPDWLELTNGNWSPWYVDENGQRLWNPTRGYNAWIDSISDDQKAWLDHADLFWGLWSQINPYAFTGYPDDDTRDDDENGIPDRVEIDEALDSFDFETYIARVEEISQKPYLGAPMLDHMSDQIVAIIENHGIEDKAAPYDPEWDEMHNPSVVQSDQSGYSFPFTGGRFIHATLLEYLAAHDRAAEFTEYFCALYPLYRLRLDDQRLISIMIVQGAMTHFLDIVSSILTDNPSLLNERQLTEIQDAVSSFELMPLAITHELVGLHDSARLEYDVPEFGGGDNIVNGRLSSAYEDLPIEIQELLRSFDVQVQAAVLDAKVHQLDSKRPAWHGDRYESISFPSGRKLDRIPWHYHTNYDAFIQRHRQFRAQNQAIRIAIAAHRHRLRQGHFPESIDAFEPDLIDFEHLDPFVRGALLYRLDEQLGPMVYARGYDDDDDLGHHGVDVHLHSKRSRTMDGDFVYYPDPYSTQPHVTIDE